MRIGIDARWIFREMTGIGTYTRELIRNLVVLDKYNHYVIFFNDEKLKNRLIDDTGLGPAENFSACVVPFGLFSITNQWYMPQILAEQRIDVYHSPNYLIPLRAFPRNQPGQIRCVTSIHDLIPLVFPEYAPRSRKRRLSPLYHWIMHQVGTRSDIILTGSQSARDDILLHLRIPPEREQSVMSIPDGVSSRFKPLPQDTSSSGAGPDFIPGTHRGARVILWVGRPDPYKNLTGLIEAFARLREQCRFPVVLRLVGPKDPRYPEAAQLAAKLGVERDVVWTGYVTDDQLVREYQQADVFILPSRYEGFGLPVLEAMACGIPVICSNKGALPEVAGDAALKVQPQDILGLSEAMKRILTDHRLAEDMVARGFQQASKFTWTVTAQKTLDAYWKALT
ncbi:MAG: glycosyltransferase family 4 protein [Verrucomicrobia bacterium]|nr:glycosyltransferase family 4 protein [Verrucomicrobiota bacterium]MBU4292411.1 glycosyltransferase family 4 protein [Verrucomicrobiota bacterium]MBU4429769.1 glycosyltransferase family 4 protein [Verrucomicrobiota bacterium]MBU4497354.1 glycosyltransferase family 4 protein [Verrucomicrobiota bacterium]MCG2679834.1 glycosyltransferase family 4 protein [Kiritimatiellia bacterium]